MTTPRVQYQPSDEVDFVIIGSGAAGGILAKELSTNGFRVVVLEQRGRTLLELMNGFGVQRSGLGGNVCNR